MPTGRFDPAAVVRRIAAAAVGGLCGGQRGSGGGKDALRSARIAPARFEANPKRCIDDGSVLLGDRVVPIVDLIGAVLSRVAAEAIRVGGRVDELTMTFPSTWGDPRRAVLTGAAASAGLPPPRLASEPVAAAAYFSTGAGAPLRPGASAVVQRRR